MSRPTARARERPWLPAGSLFGLGFVVTWWSTSALTPGAVGARSTTSQNSVLSPGASHSGSTWTRQIVAAAGFLGTIEAAKESTAIHASDLTDWMRFRNDHDRLARVTEMAVRWGINSPSPLREIANDCAVHTHASAPPDLMLSAEIEIRDRTAMLQGWSCERDETVNVDEFCDCLLGHFPTDLTVAIPPEVSAEELTSYQGVFLLRTWRM